jgi:hypothetical protein
VPIFQTTHQRSTALFADLLCRNSLKSGKRPNVASADRNELTFPRKKNGFQRAMLRALARPQEMLVGISRPQLYVNRRNKCTTFEHNFCPSLYRLPPSPKIFNDIKPRSSTPSFTQTGQPIRNAAAPIH